MPADSSNNITRVPAVEVVVGAGGGTYSSGALDAEDAAAGETVEGMQEVKRNRVGVGVGLPSSTPPPGGYNYDAYPPNLLRPIGHQPPVHAAGPRKRCGNCNELGHVYVSTARRE